MSGTTAAVLSSSSDHHHHQQQQQQQQHHHHHHHHQQQHRRSSATESSSESSPRRYLLVSSSSCSSSSPSSPSSPTSTTTTTATAAQIPQLPPQAVNNNNNNNNSGSISSSSSVCSSSSSSTTSSHQSMVSSSSGSSSTAGSASPLSQDHNLSFSVSTMKNSSSLGGCSTVVAGCEVPAYAIAGTYAPDFHIGFNTSDNPTVTKMLEVKYSNGKFFAPEASGDWLQYVQPARDRHEQNLEAFCDSNPDGSSGVAVRTLRSLRKGEQLFVWYSDQLARTTGIPVLTPDNIKGKQRYTCSKCRKSYLYPNSLKAHMRFRCPQSRAEILNSLGKLPSVPFAVFQSSSNRPCTTTTTSSEKSNDDVILKSSACWTPFDRLHSPPKGVAESGRPDEPRLMDKSRSSFTATGFLPRSMGSSTTCTSSSSSDPNLASEIALNLSTKTTGPERNLSSSSTGDRLPQSTTQPIQIFNHIHPPAIPFAFEHSAFQCYCPFYTKFHDPTRFCCASIPSVNPGTAPRNSHENVYFSHPCPMPFPLVQVRNLPGSPVMSGPQQANVDENLRMRELPLKFPLPSENAGEPLDLLPRSLYTSKSRKGHLCIYCGKLYSRKYGLKIHLRTHTGYKPLKCKVCLRPFGDPSNLNKHIRLHAEGDTPYRCEFCGKVLVRRRDLERHIKSRHPAEADKSEGREIGEEADSMPTLKVEPDGSTTEEDTNP